VNRDVAFQWGGKVVNGRVEKTDQPVEKLVAELRGDPMSVTVREFLRVERQVKGEKEDGNGKRGAAEVDKGGKWRCNGGQEVQEP
jgi:hypothetical protein